MFIDTAWVDVERFQHTKLREQSGRFCIWRTSLNFDFIGRYFDIFKKTNIFLSVVGKENNPTECYRENLPNFFLLSKRKKLKSIKSRVYKKTKVLHISIVLSVYAMNVLIINFFMKR